MLQVQISGVHMVPNFLFSEPVPNSEYIIFKLVLQWLLMIVSVILLSSFHDFPTDDLLSKILI